VRIGCCGAVRSPRSPACGRSAVFAPGAPDSAGRAAARRPEEAASGDAAARARSRRGGRARARARPAGPARPCRCGPEFGPAHARTPVLCARCPLHRPPEGLRGAGVPTARMVYSGLSALWHALCDGAAAGRPARHLPRLRPGHPGLLPASERARARGSGAHSGQASAAAARRDAHRAHPPRRHICRGSRDCCAQLAQAASGGSSAPAATTTLPRAACSSRPRPARCRRRRALPPARRCMPPCAPARCLLAGCEAARPAAAGQGVRHVQGQRVACAWRAAAAGGCADRAAGVTEVQELGGSPG